MACLFKCLMSFNYLLNGMVLVPGYSSSSRRFVTRQPLKNPRQTLFIILRQYRESIIDSRPLNMRIRGSFCILLGVTQLLLEISLLHILAQ
jgi:hypothetical protein